ncbi:MAG: thioredoxin [Flavobacteriales bacterium]|jgi:thioredoxin 1|nr:thioredoxin [Flavobacteriales bacterium]
MSKFNSLINGDKPVLVDVFAEWCQPCKLLSPILKEIKHEFSQQLTIIKVNIDNNQQIAEKFNIKGVPTLLLFKKGKLIWRQAGIHTKNELTLLIEQKLKVN